MARTADRKSGVLLFCCAAWQKNVSVNRSYFLCVRTDSGKNNKADKIQKTILVGRSAFDGCTIAGNKRGQFHSSTFFPKKRLELFSALGTVVFYSADAELSGGYL